VRTRRLHRKEPGRKIPGLKMSMVANEVTVQPHYSTAHRVRNREEAK